MSTPDAEPATALAAVAASSVYRVSYVVATHDQGWAEAAQVAIADVAKSIPDLRIARVIEKDVALLEDGLVLYRVKLAVSYRIDRHRVLGDGTVTDVRRYLVVANQTVTSDALHRAIRERIERGPAEFHIVMPIRLPLYASVGLAVDPMSGFFSAESIAEAEKDAGELALQPLADALARIRAAGATATGEVATTDPVAATTAVLDRASFDEILLSTLPRNISRWLGFDLQQRLARHTRIPITRVKAEAP